MKGGTTTVPAPQTKHTDGMTTKKVNTCSRNSHALIQAF